MPSIPVDILRLILNHVDKADLLTVCSLNKICCSCSQDVLYRDIQIYELRKGTQVCQTLARSTHLARRVRSFDISNNFKLKRLCNYPELSTSLQNMTFLRSLTLYSFPYKFGFLGGCTFKLVSFACRYFGSKPLHQFLLSQPSLTNVGFGFSGFSGFPRDIVDSPEFEMTFLPNVTRVSAEFSLLAQIIPGRPVNEVKCIGCASVADSVDLSFFTRSTAPIHKILINYTYLYPESRLLASIFPSLTHLNIYVGQLNFVRGPDFF
jgi:hypothetical protein